MFGKIITSERYYMLIPGACEYVTLLVTWDFIAVIKDSRDGLSIVMMILKEKMRGGGREEVQSDEP